jgi:hypothetical protein
LGQAHREERYLQGSAHGRVFYARDRGGSLASGSGGSAFLRLETDRSTVRP